MPEAYCPECDATICMDNPRNGIQFKCPECAVELEVISTDPFDVYFVFEGDWDDAECDE